MWLGHLLGYEIPWVFWSYLTQFTYYREYPQLTWETYKIVNYINCFDGKELTITDYLEWKEKFNAK
jgi:hypothetical protein